MRPAPAPKKPKELGLSKWQKHFIKIAKDNPELKTNRDRHKKACETWIMESKKRYTFKL